MFIFLLTLTSATMEMVRDTLVGYRSHILDQRSYNVAITFLARQKEQFSQALRIERVSSSQLRKKLSLVFHPDKVKDFSLIQQEFSLEVQKWINDYANLETAERNLAAEHAEEKFEQENSIFVDFGYMDADLYSEDIGEFENESHASHNKRFLKFHLVTGRSWMNCFDLLNQMENDDRVQAIMQRLRKKTFVPREYQLLYMTESGDLKPFSSLKGLNHPEIKGKRFLVLRPKTMDEVGGTQPMRNEREVWVRLMFVEEPNILKIILERPRSETSVAQLRQVLQESDDVWELLRKDFHEMPNFKTFKTKKKKTECLGDDIFMHTFEE